MAEAANLSAAILFLIFLSISAGPPPLLLPLFLSSPTNHSSRTFHRRHLQPATSDRHPIARMGLYDDLLLNGYYTTRLWIGSPPQRFALIVDTGSTVTYVPCSTCKQCGRHQDPKFQPESSSTYQPVKCNIDCNCDDDREQCIYERQYAEMSTSSGVLGEDVISFGNRSELAPQRAVFGCENVETGDLYSQHADGIMGLGRGDLSVVDQLVDKGVISDSFSLCYGGMDVGGGTMILGGITPPQGMAFTESDPVRSPYYNIDLKAIHVAGKPLPLDPGIFDGKHGTVLDSGTTYAYLPEAAFVAFKTSIMKELHPLKQIRGPDPNYNDICFSGAGRDVSQLPQKFPAVDMVFGNGQKLTLSPENYLFRHSKISGAYCLGIFQNGKDPTTLLGGIIARNTLVTYDRENATIGFWKTNCSELWKRLNFSDGPTTLPSASEGNNSTTVVPQTVVPGGSPQYNISGGSQIAEITFAISFNFSYSNMKPHITELTEHIAQELDVNVSEVHSLNFKSEGNSSLTEWAIHPADPANHLSNATAMAIIAKLVEHHLHLPHAFGNNQVVEWDVKLSVERTWWQQHYLVVVLTVIITLIIGLSASVIWLMWRNKQNTLSTYKPVDAVLPEQELQPINS